MQGSIAIQRRCLKEKQKLENESEIFSMEKFHPFSRIKYRKKCYKLLTCIFLKEVLRVHFYSSPYVCTL